MLPKYDRFIFPDIKGIRRHSQDGFVCRLDWSAKNEYDKKLDNALLLPEPYNSMVESQKFCLPFSYRKEIGRCSENAIKEWNLQRSFDTNIREQCLKPAIEFVRTAFMLMADAALDYHPGYFETNILECSMLYKFWANQTGNGLIKRNAGIDELEQKIAVSKQIGMANKKECSKAEEFINAINKYEKERQQKSNQKFMYGKSAS